MPEIPASLAGRTVAVPETRELDVFAELLARRGATVLRCPLVGIADAPQPGLVLDWLRRFAAGGCDDLILLTGEGLRRLLGCIDRHQPALRQPFLDALARVRRITRGPKPARVLRELGLKPDIAAAEPTSAGIVEALRGESLAGRRVGVQLYGQDPNRLLVDFLQDEGAQVDAVAPYIYVPAASDAEVRTLIERMGAGAVDAIAFTSKAQVARLFEVAEHTVGLPALLSALGRTQVAAVGPVVREALESRGIEHALMPEDSWFLKPLAAVLGEELGPQRPGSRHEPGRG